MPDEIVLKFSVRDDGSPSLNAWPKGKTNHQRDAKPSRLALKNARRSVMDFASENAGLIAVLTGTALALKKLYDTAREGRKLNTPASSLNGWRSRLAQPQDALLGNWDRNTRDTF